MSIAYLEERFREGMDSIMEKKDELNERRKTIRKKIELVRDLKREKE